ncbi:MAG TPA: carboxylesterase family protein [Gammaproteobacteria bacterium]|nr:carboxylesterase family protein [Gammaproteobacteria bacterium]
MKPIAANRGQSPGSDPTFSRRRVLGAGAAGLAFAPTLLAQDIRGQAMTGEVAMTAGRVQGVVLDDTTEAFWGVPYGASTGGESRFMPPKPAESWSGVRETTQVTDRSPQPLPGPISEIHALHRANPMSEDCLHVNVFTPASDNGARPVMVWLHGGGFWSGSGDWLLYDGNRLAAKEDVVVVTVTHRLNAFGFLYLPELGGSEYAQASNVGMRDIVLALDWVQDNIENFGGDPGNVTIFGQSGGGGKVSFLTAMPQAQGKYHRAIMMSGSTLEGTDADTGTETTERFMVAAGARSIADLAAMPWEQLSAEQERHGFTMGPVVDGTSLPAHPYSPEAPAMSADIPLLIGTTEFEANFFPDTPLDPIDEGVLKDGIRAAVGGNGDRAEALIDTYRAGRPDASNVDLYQIIVSDLRFGASAHAQAERKAAQGTASVYKYYFRWQSPVRSGRLKSYHCLDIPFAFNNVDVAASMTGAGNDRYTLADQISGAFAEFARSGNPNHAGLPNWRPFSTRERPTMIFDTRTRIVNDPFGNEREAIAEALAAS